MPWNVADERGWSLLSQVGASRIYRPEAGIVAIVADDKSRHSVALATLQRLVVREVARWEGQRLGLLLCMDGLVAQDSGARRTLVEQCTPELYFALAISCSSRLGQLIGKYFLGTRKLAIPVGMFDTAPDALGWLRAQRDSNGGPLQPS